jgi:hypothetical protein
MVFSQFENQFFAISPFAFKTTLVKLLKILETKKDKSEDKGTCGPPSRVA